MVIKDFAAKPFDATKLAKKNSLEKAKPLKKANRFLVLALFILTTGLSLFLWKKSELKLWWDALWEPATYEVINPEVIDDQLIRISQNLFTPQDVVRGIQELVEPLQGSYGVYVESLKSGTSYGVNQDKEFIGASVNKVLIMVKALQDIEKGILDYDDEYRLQRKDIIDYGTGSMRYDNPGKTYTVERLLYLTGRFSDNTAAHVVGLMVGEKRTQELADKLGMKKTSMADNTASPEDMGRFFSKIYHGEILTDSYREKFYEYLTRTEFEDRIPAGIPGLVSVAHKIGTEMQVVNDCGIVFEKENPYVLCILAKDVNENEALEYLPKISATVWSFESKR